MERLINWKKQKKRCFICYIYFLLLNGVMFSHSALCPRRGMKTNFTLFYIYHWLQEISPWGQPPRQRKFSLVCGYAGSVVYKTVNGRAIGSKEGDNPSYTGCVGYVPNSCSGNNLHQACGTRTHDEQPTAFVLSSPNLTIHISQT